MNDGMPYDAITTYFIFLIGLPAIVFQWLAPEIRPIVVKRARELLLDAGIPVVVAMTLVGVGINGSDHFEWTWTAILAALFCVATFTALRIPRKYVRRASVVDRVAREAGRSIGKNGRLGADALQDLLELGIQSQPGRDKEVVLQALLNLTNEMCESQSYNGDQLADVAAGVLDVVFGSTAGTAAQNLATACEILKQILRAFDAATEKTFMQTDLLHGIRAMSRLGREASRAGNDSVALAVSQALETTGDRHPDTSVATSQALFEIGMVAVEDNQVLVAMSCAESLTSLLENYGNNSRDIVADTLGLLAHFWETGHTGRAYAEQHLSRIEQLLDNNLTEALSQSALHCAQTTQFRTADKIHRLVAERIG
jgi:hypothetical protein